jgi:hypothetical protein
MLAVIVMSQKTHMLKEQGIMPDMSGRKTTAQGLAMVHHSLLTKVARSTRRRKLNTRSARPRIRTSLGRSCDPSQAGLPFRVRIDTDIAE